MRGWNLNHLTDNRWDNYICFPVYTEIITRDIYRTSHCQCNEITHSIHLDEIFKHVFRRWLMGIKHFVSFFLPKQVKRFNLIWYLQKKNVSKFPKYPLAAIMYLVLWFQNSIFFQCPPLPSPPPKKKQTISWFFTPTTPIK